MDDKFTWTPELTLKLFKLRFEYAWLFKKKKQPWTEFRKILLQKGFPEEMSLNHVRKKWSYTYDSYKIAKRENNKDWKYYKLFDKHFGKTKILDWKYESWSDEWRLKLIICITEAKLMKLDDFNLWRTVEQAMRSQDLPFDCCIQDIKGLWHHIRAMFNRKYLLTLKKGAELTEWPLYETMLEYFSKTDPQYLERLETESDTQLGESKSNSRKKKDFTKQEDTVSEFQWSKDITESFIQIRLQNDWMFREKPRAWERIRSMMIEEYGFPKTLTSRELSKKWASTFADYQKSKATNNKSWLYNSLFELYLGEGSMSLNPLIGWQEEWVMVLIESRSELANLFVNVKDETPAWSEHWPYYEAMSNYTQSNETANSSCDYIDDDYDDDDMKLIDIRQSDSLPYQICLICLQELESAYKFRRKCQEVDKRLRNTSDNQIKTETSIDDNISLNDEVDHDHSDEDYKMPVEKKERTKKPKPKIKIEAKMVNRRRKKMAHMKYDYWKICEICGKSTRNLVHHLDSHSSDKLYSCDVCQKKFKFKSGLSIHKAKHDPTPKKTCEVCGKTFHIMAQYRRHYVYHANERKFECETCGKRFHTSDILRVHCRSHTDERPFSCPDCGKTFRTAGCVSRHRRLVHKDRGTTLMLS
ncbi:unnamed protein product [Leptidea sinapis]|uniref:C2H2-type domain-containing protein n=1 Tax=Leptidea sinapis TaxID=189913 RepID=A0A5E4PQG5_9NEOP|nr:unnamed protein product [Leptidea sinapis]